MPVVKNPPSFIPPENKSQEDFTTGGDFHGNLANKTYKGQTLLRNSIDETSLKKLKDLTSTMVHKVINEEIPIISLMAKFIESDEIKEHLLIYKPESKTKKAATPAETKTLIGERESVFYSTGDGETPSTFTLLGSQQKESFFDKQIKTKINSFTTGDYSYYNDPKSEKYLTAHNHPDGTMPSNVDLRVSGLGLGLVLTQNSAYFIDYRDGVENTNKLKETFLKYNKALSNACLETKRNSKEQKGLKKEDRKILNERLQFSSKLLSCDLKTYKSNSNLDELSKPFTQKQISLINDCIEFGKNNPLFAASMQKILETPEALNVLANALEIYEDKIGNNSAKDFRQILIESLTEVFNAQTLFAIDRLDFTHQNSINSEILTNLPQPKKLATSIVTGNPNHFLFSSTLLDWHNETNLYRNDEITYFKSIQDKFGIKIARVPLKEILNEEQYNQFQHKKAEFVRDLFLDDKFSECSNARQYWLKSFMPINVHEGVTAINQLPDNAIWQTSLLANKAVKVLSSNNIEDLRTAYNNLSSKKKKLFFLSELWKESPPSVKHLNEIISAQELKRFSDDFHQLCLRKCVRGFMRSFKDRLDLDSSHLEQVNFIASQYQDEGYANEIIDAIGHSLKKKGSQVDEKMYEFFKSDRIPSKCKEELAALLPLQERNNPYYEKLRKDSVRNYYISFKLMNILQAKLKPFSISDYQPNLTKSKNIEEQKPKTNASTETGSSKVNDIPDKARSSEQLAEIISDFKLFASKTTVINSNTLKYLSEITPIYLNTKFPPSFTLDSLDVGRYADDLIEVLREIDNSHYSKNEFKEIKKAFLEYLNNQKIKFEKNLLSADVSVLKEMAEEKIVKNEAKIEFFESLP
ncbi:MAG: hypothetical protein HRT47_07430 [Candidatus Caenarcaniphilales bacterium]|nr:hypothetical protein [Candidatus Caenarcaniphilales bacterium]